MRVLFGFYYSLIFNALHFGMQNATPEAYEYQSRKTYRKKHRGRQRRARNSQGQGQYRNPADTPARKPCRAGGRNRRRPAFQNGLRQAFGARTRHKERARFPPESFRFQFRGVHVQFVFADDRAGGGNRQAHARRIRFDRASVFGDSRKAGARQDCGPFQEFADNSRVGGVARQADARQRPRDEQNPRGHLRRARKVRR